MGEHNFKKRNNCLVRFGTIIQCFVLIILSFYTTQNIIEGPLKKLLRNSTVIRQNELDINESEQSLVWPDLAFYTMPFVKNHTAYQKFMARVQSNEFENEQEYDSHAREALYSDPKDFFLALNMAKDYQTAVGNLSRIPIEPPFVRVVLNDYMYNGYIGVISLEAIRQFLIKEGDIESDMKDFDFDLIVSLNGIGRVKDTTFNAKPVMNGEDSLVGVDTLNIISQKAIVSGKMNVFHMYFELEKRLRNCQEIPRITSCLKGFFDNEYGVAFKNRHLRLFDQINTKYGGYQKVTERTGCLRPCEETTYRLEEFISFNAKDLPDPYVQEFLSRYENTSQISLVVISHQKSKLVTQNEEVLEYDIQRLISEVGGIVGIFVGLSFWSLYLDFIIPIISFINNRLKK